MNTVDCVFVFYLVDFRKPVHANAKMFSYKTDFSSNCCDSN